MWSEDDVWLFSLDRRYDFFDGGGAEGGLRAMFDRAGFQNGGFGCNFPHIQDLAPAKTEKTVANDQAVFAVGELAGYRFHTEGAAAGNDCDGLCFVNSFQGVGNIAHCALKRLRHVVERAVGEDHGVFQQSVGIDIGQ